MGAVASQITSITIVYSTVYSSAHKKSIKESITGLCVGNSPVTGEFLAQMASNAENVSIWWRHHVMGPYVPWCIHDYTYTPICITRPFVICLITSLLDDLPRHHVRRHHVLMLLIMKALHGGVSIAIDDHIKYDALQWLHMIVWSSWRLKSPATRLV